MAQFGQTLMSSKQPSYLDVLRQKEEVKPKFNLFDFSSTKSQQPIQTKQLNFGAPMSGKNITNFSDYKQTIPQQTQPTQKSGFSLIPTANADFGQEDIETFRDLVDKGIEPERAKNLIIKSKTPQDFSAEEGLLQNLGERYKQFTTKEDEGFLRTFTKGAIPYDLQKAGALGKAFQDVIGYGIEKSLSPELKKQIADTIGEDNLQKLDQLGQIWNKNKENIKQIPGGTEAVDIAENFLATQDLIGTIQGGKSLITGGAKVLTKGGKQIIDKSATLGKTIETQGENFRNAIAGLDEKEVMALKNTPRQEWEGIINQAKQAKDNDYIQTPYNEGAKKANEAFKNLESNLEINQTKRVEELQKSGISAIDTVKVRQDIVTDLEKTFNVKGIDIKDGKVTYKTTPGRESLLDETNPRNLEAIKLLEKATRSRTPLQMMDNIKKMQNLIYDSNMLNKLGKDMENLITRSIGKLNQAFKEQVGGNYANILDDMAQDIKIKNELVRIFKASSGEEALNRGELAMKRLANGTTTSAEARQLALLVKEKTGIDLIKEARLRQLAMDLVGDTRGTTLFGAIEKGPKGVIDYALGKARDLSPFSKEKTALARTKLLKPNNTKNANTSSNTTSNTTNKQTNSKTTSNSPLALPGTNSKLLKAPTTSKEIVKQEPKPTPLKTKPFNKSETIKKLQTLTKDNVDDVVKSITTDKTKLAQVKQVIEKYLKEYGENIKNYLGLLADDIADIVGGRVKLLGGENAKLFDKSRWQQAKEMTNAGKSADEIWQKTGWEKGTDGKWKFEIDDSKAKVKEIDNNKLEKAHIENMDKQDKLARAIMLPDLLDHPQLFEQYPNLNSVKVYFSNKSSLGGFDNDLVITLNDKFLNKGSSKLAPLYDGAKLQDPKSTLLHEIQHYIQSKEGFARGGSVSKHINFEGNKELDMLYSDYRKWNNYLQELKKGKEVILDKGKPYEYKLSLSKTEEMVDNLDYKINNLENNLKSEMEQKNISDYKSLAGETEARNIQTRLLKTPAERKILRPAKTEDVERKNQIIKMEGGKSMLLPTNSKQVSKVSDELINEAKKYKSAEEFIGENIFKKTKLNGYKTRIENNKGYADYYIDEYDGGKQLVIEMIEVKETGKGYGNRIMQELDDIAIEKNVDRIALHAFEQGDVPTESLVDFYKKHGYMVESGEKGWGYGMVKNEEDINFSKYKKYDKEQNKIINYKTKEQLKKIYEQSKPKLIKPTKTKPLPTNSKQVSKVSDDLINEAKKYKSADEFIKAQKNIKQRGQRGWAAPGIGDNSLNNVLKGKHNQPSDYFDIKRWDSNWDRETKEAIQEASKTGEITIYRAVPKNINTWRDGDWVYFNKNKAIDHGNNALEGDYHILSKTVKNKDVYWDGNDINEWGYDTGIETKKLKDIWEQAEKQGLKIPVAKNIDNDITALKELARKLEREGEWDELGKIQKQIYEQANKPKLIKPTKTKPLPTNSKQVSKASDELINEAKKYKSADEFIKANKFIEVPKINWGTIPEEGIKAEIPLNKLRVGSKALDIATRNVKRGDGSRTAGDIEVVMLKDGTFAIYEGHHRTVQKALQKDKNIRATVYSSKDFFDSQVRDWDALDTTFSKEETLTKQQLKQIYEQSKPKLIKPTKTKPLPTNSKQVSKVSDELKPLIEEAKKYKSADEFYDDYTANSIMDLSNRSKHKYGRLLEDGVDEDTMRYMDAKYTADIYGKRGNNEYKWQKEANVPDVNSPEDIVTIYRGTVKSQKNMEPGDFVTFSKEYALSHNEGAKLLTLKVPAKDVVWQGADLHEWIYSPEKLRGGNKYTGGLKKLWEQATKK